MNRTKKHILQKLRQINKVYLCDTHKIEEGTSPSLKYIFHLNIPNEIFRCILTVDTNLLLNSYRIYPTKPVVLMLKYTLEIYKPKGVPHTLEISKPKECVHTSTVYFVHIANSKRVILKLVSDNVIQIFLIYKNIVDQIKEDGNG